MLSSVTADAIATFRMSLLLRNFAWRIGRRIYAEARGDVRNDPYTNGEYALVGWVAELCNHSTTPVFLVTTST